MRSSAFVLLACLAGCSPADRPDADSAGASTVQDAGGDPLSHLTKADGPDTKTPGRLPPNAELAGRWTGPEGLTAGLTPLDDGRMRIAMRYSLDDEGTFQATRVGDTLGLDRPDGRVVLSYGAGEQTGMKWADADAHCLIAKVGSEAYCRTES